MHLPAMRRAITATVSLATLISLAACSTKAADNSSGDDGDLKTDYGVSDTEITLGALTDTSGAFKAGGLAAVYGHQIWADEVNDAGGICGRDIVIDIKDHGYKADNALPLYDQMRESDLGLIQLLGSPMLAALKQRLVTDQMLAGVPSMASNNLDTPQIISVTTTYDVEMLNGLAYMQDEGMLNDGDKIGQIYLDSEAGQNTLAGTQAYAEQHDLDIVEIPISATDTDMTATVAKLKEENVKIVAVMSSPATLASLGVAMSAQGMDAPILGAGPTYSPALLGNQQTVDALTENYYIATSAAAWGSDFPKAQEVTAAYEALGVTDAPSGTVYVGYLAGLAWGAVLEQACDDGDLTRAGVMAARDKIDNLDTGGLSGTLDLSDPGAPTTREIYIDKIKADGSGIEAVHELFTSEEAADYKAPFES